MSAVGLRNIPSRNYPTKAVPVPLQGSRRTTTKIKSIMGFSFLSPVRCNETFLNAQLPIVYLSQHPGSPRAPHILSEALRSDT